MPRAYDFYDMQLLTRRILFPCALALALAAIASAQAPQITGVQVPGNANPAVVSPGAIVEIDGSGFGSTPSGITVSAGGANGYVISMSATAIQAQLPVTLPTQGTATLTVTTPAGSASAVIALAYASPAFTGFAPGSGIPFVMDYKDQSAQVVPFPIDLQHPAVPGDYLVVQASGLGLTTPPLGGPPAPTGVTPPGSSYTAQVQPAISVGTALIPSSATKATLIPGGVGLFAVNFQLPQNGVPSGSDAFSLNISNSNTVAMTLPVDPGIAVITGIVNGANFATNTPVAPGSIASLFTSNLESALYNGIFPANLVHNTSIAINSLATPMYDLLGPSNQVNIQIPTELPDTGSVTVVLTNSKGASLPFTLQMSPAAPGIFRINAPGSNAQNAAVLFSGKKWYAMSAAFAQSLGIPANCAANGINALSYCGQPAKAGDNLEIYATGLGTVTPGGDPNGIPLATGVVAPLNPQIPYETPQKPTVTVGGVPANVGFSGIAPGFAGLYQINIVVPAGVAPGDSVPIKLAMPTSPISDTASIAVE